jgi:hypothetical protein
MIPKHIFTDAHIPYYGEDTDTKKESEPLDKTK